MTPPPPGSTLFPYTTLFRSGVAGDVGSLVSVTGFPMPAPALCTLVGTVHALEIGRAHVCTPVTDQYPMLASARNNTANNLTGQQLGGKTLAPGVYYFDTTAL